MTRATIKAFLNDESGATAIEYALLATLIGMTIIVSVLATGDNLRNMFGGNSASVLEAQAAKVK